MKDMGASSAQRATIRLHELDNVVVARLDVRREARAATIETTEERRQTPIKPKSIKRKDAKTAEKIKVQRCLRSSSIRPTVTDQAGFDSYV